MSSMNNNIDSVFDLQYYLNENINTDDLNRYQRVKHLENELFNFDPTTNKLNTVKFYQVNKNYCRNLIQENTVFFNDFMMHLFYFAKPHIEKIFQKPKQKMLKYHEIKDFSKVTVFDRKTMKWITRQPGKTYTSKLGQKNKIYAQQKEYTYNTKENQQLYYLLTIFNKYFSIILQKESAMINKHYTEMKSFCVKYKKEYSEMFSDVEVKQHHFPNNALIDHLNYKAIWNASVLLKTFNEDYAKYNDINKIELYWIYIMIRTHMENIKGVYLEEMELEYDLHNLRSTSFKARSSIYFMTITFENQIGEILITSYNYLNNEWFEKHVRYDDIQNKYINLIDDKVVSSFSFNLSDIKTIIDGVLNPLKSDKLKYLETFSSGVQISGFYNLIYTDSEEQLLALHEQYGKYYKYKRNSFYVKDSQVKMLGDLYDNPHSFNGEEIGELVNSIHNDKDAILYDFPDYYTDFELSGVKNEMFKIPQAVGVPKSVLAYYSFKNVQGTKRFIDITVKNIYETKVYYKNNMVYRDLPKEKETLDISEYAFLESYLNEITEKRLSKESMSKIIKLGLIYKLLSQKNTIYIYGDDKERIEIEYNKELFNKLMNIWKGKLGKNKDVFYIIPNYMRLNLPNVVYMKSLFRKQTELREKINKKLTYYVDYLPELSLENISNGTYDRIRLVNRNVNYEHSNSASEKTICKIRDLELHFEDNKMEFPLMKKEISGSTQFKASIRQNTDYTDELFDLEVLYNPTREYAFQLVFHGQKTKRKHIAEWEKVRYENNKLAIPFRNKSHSGDITKTLDSIVKTLNWIRVHYKVVKSERQEEKNKKLIRTTYMLQEQLAYNKRNKEIVSGYIDQIEEISETILNDLIITKEGNRIKQNFLILLYILNDQLTNKRIVNYLNSYNDYNWSVKIKSIPLKGFDYQFNKYLIMKKDIGYKEIFISRLMDIATVDTDFFQYMYVLKSDEIDFILSRILSNFNKLLNKQVETNRIYALLFSTLELLLALMNIRNKDQNFLSLEDSTSRKIVSILKKLSKAYSISKLESLEQKYLEDSGKDNFKYYTNRLKFDWKKKNAHLYDTIDYIALLIAYISGDESVSGISISV